MSDTRPTRKGAGNFIYGLLAIVIVVLLIVILRPQDSAAPENGGSDTTAGNEVTTSPNKEKNFEYTLPEDWRHQARATNGINQLTPGQSISFGIVQDPTDENIVYFAASTDIENDEVTISIYRYRTDNYNFERLYRRNYGAGDFAGISEGMWPVARVLGYDSGKLIVLWQGNNDSPDPCAEPLLLGGTAGRSLVAIDINDPYGGMDDYTLPADIASELEDNVNACYNETFAE